jgi:hypothetical protein
MNDRKPIVSMLLRLSKRGRLMFERCHAKQLIVPKIT